MQSEILETGTACHSTFLHFVYIQMKIHTNIISKKLIHMYIILPKFVKVDNLLNSQKNYNYKF